MVTANCNSTNRIVVRFATEQFMMQVDKNMWQEEPYLLHGTDREDFPELQPILLTCSNKILNKANVCLLTEGTDFESLEGKELIDRLIIVFSENSVDEINKAREQFGFYQKQNCNLSYYKQDIKHGLRLLKKRQND